MPDIAIPAELWRGGTSRGIVLERDVIAELGLSAECVLRAGLGSPDPWGRQVDGVGGGASSLSKGAIVAPSVSADHDIDFGYAQVGITDDTVEFVGDCGNLTAVAGPYAVDRGWVNTSGDLATVRIRSTNTGATILATVAVSDDVFDPEGATVIDGVPGTGSPVRMTWLLQQPSYTSQWPVGRDPVRVGQLAGRFVVVAAPLFILDGETLGTPTPADFDADHADLLAQLNRFRRAAAVEVGLAATLDAVPAAVPKVAVIWQSQTERGPLATRAISMDAVHRTIPLTVAMGLAADTAASQAARGPLTVAIRHPAGTATVQVHASGSPECPHVDEVTTERTARRLMRGDLTIPTTRARP